MVSEVTLMRIRRLCLVVLFCEFLISVLVLVVSVGREHFGERANLSLGFLTNYSQPWGAIGILVLGLYLIVLLVSLTPWKSSVLLDRTLAVVGCLGLLIPSYIYVQYLGFLNAVRISSPLLPAVQLALIVQLPRLRINLFASVVRASPRTYYLLTAQACLRLLWLFLMLKVIAFINGL